MKILLVFLVIFFVEVLLINFWCKKKLSGNFGALLQPAAKQLHLDII